MKAVAKGQATGLTITEQLVSAVEKNILTQGEADQVAEFDVWRIDALAADEFTQDYLAGKKVEHVAGQKVV